MATFPIGLLAFAIVLAVFWFVARPVARAIAEEEDAGDRLLAIYENPQRCDATERAFAASLGYLTVLDDYGPLIDGEARVLSHKGLQLRSCRWQPHGALLQVDILSKPPPDGLYLQAWDDNGVFHRPLRQAEDNVRRVTRLWRGTAWIDSAALRTEHRPESGLLLEVRHTRDASLLLSLLTQQPSDVTIAAQAEGVAQLPETRDSERFGVTAQQPGTANATKINTSKIDALALPPAHVAERALPPATNLVARDESTKKGAASSGDSTPNATLRLPRPGNIRPSANASITPLPAVVDHADAAERGPRPSVSDGENTAVPEPLIIRSSETHTQAFSMEHASSGAADTNEIARTASISREANTKEIALLPSTSSEPETKNIARQPVSSGEAKTKDIVRKPVSSGEANTKDIGQASIVAGAAPTEALKLAPRHLREAEAQQQAADSSDLVANLPLTPWVLWVSAILPPHASASALEALGRALGVEAELRAIHRTHLPKRDTQIPLSELVMEGAVRFDPYATGDLLAAVASQREHIAGAQIAGVKAIYKDLAAEAIWQAFLPTSLVPKWRRAEALRELGVSATASKLEAEAALQRARALCAEDALGLDETGLDDLVASQEQHLTAIAEQLSQYGDA